MRKALAILTIALLASSAASLVLSGCEKVRYRLVPTAPDTVVVHDTLRVPRDRCPDDDYRQTESLSR